MALPKLAGIREPGLRRAGRPSSTGGGGGGGATTAVAVSIADTGNYFTSTNAEGALAELGAGTGALAALSALEASDATAAQATATALATLLARLISVATGQGASTIALDANDTLTSSDVEAGLNEVKADAATANTAASSASSAAATAGTAAAAASTAAAAATTAAGSASTAAAAASTAAAAASTAAGLRPLTTDLASTAAGKGASTIGIQDAGSLITATQLEAALAELATNIAANLTAIGLRPLTADLAALTAGKGASTIGIQDAGSLITATQLEAALAELATNIAGHTTAIGLRLLTTDLASTATGKGATLVGLKDVGTYYATKTVEFALQQVGPASQVTVTGITTGASLVPLWDAGGYFPTKNVEAGLQQLGAAVLILQAAAVLVPYQLNDVSATKLVTDGSEFTLPLGTLTANRTLTLGTTSAVAGEVVRIVRRDTSAFTYAIVNGGVGAGTLITLPVSVARVVDLRFDGSNWYLAGVSRLS